MYGFTLSTIKTSRKRQIMWTNHQLLSNSKTSDDISNRRWLRNPTIEPTYKIYHRLNTNWSYLKDVSKHLWTLSVKLTYLLLNLFETSTSETWYTTWRSSYNAWAANRVLFTDFIHKLSISNIYINSLPSCILSNLMPHARFLSLLMIKLSQLQIYYRSRATASFDVL